MIRILGQVVMVNFTVVELVQQDFLPAEVDRIFGIYVALGVVNGGKGGEILQKQSALTTQQANL